MRQSGGVRPVGSNGPRDGSAFTPGRDLASTLAQLVKQSPVLDLDDQDPFKVALLGKVAAMAPPRQSLKSMQSAVAVALAAQEQATAKVNRCAATIGKFMVQFQEKLDLLDSFRFGAGGG